MCCNLDSVVIPYEWALSVTPECLFQCWHCQYVSRSVVSSIVTVACLWSVGRPFFVLHEFIAETLIIMLHWHMMVKGNVHCLPALLLSKVLVYVIIIVECKAFSWSSFIPFIYPAYSIACKRKNWWRQKKMKQRVRKQWWKEMWLLDTSLWFHTILIIDFVGLGWEVVGLGWQYRESPHHFLMTQVVCLLVSILDQR